MRTRALLLIAILASALTPGSARAEWFCERERLPDDYSSAHPRLDRMKLDDGRILNVLRPPGYDDHADARYPVLHLLHGGIQSADSWLLHTNVYEFTERWPGIVVLPEGDLYGSWLDRRDGSQSIETWFVNELVPFVDDHYLTITDRAHRAIAGFSGGGLGTANIAARHPELFGTAGILSGVVDVVAPSGLWIAAGANMASSACGTGSPTGMWGTPGIDEVWFRAANPTDLALNLGGTNLYVASGSGAPCDEQELPFLASGDPRWQAEPFVRDMSRNFDRALRDAGVAHTTVEYPCSIHWMGLAERELHDFWPFLVSGLGRRPPTAFDAKRAEARFSVWDWTFSADATRAPEFLTIADASCDGLGLSGSGITSVTTAPCFEPGATVRVGGAQVAADSEGRITFTIDLGPVHVAQQYTPAARALEAAGGYWTSKAIRFNRGGVRRR